MIYQFKYLLHDSDYMEFNKFHLRNSPLFQKAIIIFRLIVPILLLLYLVVLEESYKNLDDLVLSILITAFLSIAWGLIVKPLFLLGVKITIKLEKKSGKLPYGKEMQIEFYESFLIDTTEDIVTSVNYTGIKRIGVSDTAMYLYISAIQAFVIPISVFKSEEERERFLTFINNKVPVSIDKSM